MKVEHTYSTSSKANENEGDDDHLESFLSQRNFAGTLNWLYDNFTNVGAGSMSKLEKMLADEAPLQSDCQPCSQSMKYLFSMSTLIFEKKKKRKSL
ncbi:hypothetical protein DPMN_027719 [Dreissena polymorpha]|uniref:Uncharacterized protein n=1 Tax=Dreissena polymorpha TaxID=45954 RepID=A0A9D4LVP6_DREPO|nr:hypothetical protein DPMN_027719 [Dreissena polymorpha]